ncbi:ribonuclease P protein component [Patescibacteria group bacterium]
MPQKQSLPKKGIDFEKIIRQGKSIKEDLLFLKKIENNLDRSRFAISVSKKVSKKATTRNKIKRRIKNLLSKKILKIKKGVDLLFVALPGIEKKTFKEIEFTIDKLFKKQKL